MLTIVGRVGNSQREHATEFLNSVSSIPLEDQQSFGGTHLQFDQNGLQRSRSVAEGVEAIGATLRDYMIDRITEVGKCFGSAESAAKSVEIFESQWLNHASDRAIQTLCAGIVASVDITPAYLGSMEALNSIDTLPSTAIATREVSDLCEFKASMSPALG